MFRRIGVSPMTHDERVPEVLRRWQALRDSGSQLTPEELCADDTELLESVKAQMQAALASDKAPRESFVTRSTLFGSARTPAAGAGAEGAAPLSGNAVPGYEI